MASYVLPTTKTVSLFRGFVTFVIVWIVACHGVEGQCQLPRRLRGRWEDSLKGELTFRNDSVSGYDIHVFGEFTLACHLYNSSTYYIMESPPFSYFGLNFSAFMCWSFAEQSSRLIHLYEHTAPNPQAGNERVKMFLPITSWAFEDVCSETNSTSLYYRELNKQNRRKKFRVGRSSILTAVGISVVAVVGVAVIVIFVVNRRRKSRGMFQVNAKTANSRGKGSAYQVNEPENHAPTLSPASSSSKKSTVTGTTTALPELNGHRNISISPTQVDRHPSEDSTSEATSSPSTVSVTATSAFTSVSGSSSSSASSSVFASGSTSGLPNQEVSSPMTPVCGSDGTGDKQFGFNDQFVSVQFGSSQGAGLDEGGASAYMAETS